jgi:hypothetical protein
MGANCVAFAFSIELIPPSGTGGVGAIDRKKVMLIIIDRDDQGSCKDLTGIHYLRKDSVIPILILTNAIEATKEFKAGK